MVTVLRNQVIRSGYSFEEEEKKEEEEKRGKISKNRDLHCSVV